MTKITEYTSGDTLSISDLLVFIDTSDTSQAASGTGKRVDLSKFARTDGTTATTTGGGTLALGGCTATIPKTQTAVLTGHTHVVAEITDYDPSVALDGNISDVTITSPADNEVLAYDGVDTWINQTPAEASLAEAGHTHTESEITDLGSYLTSVAINEISDITIASPADNEVLAYDGVDTWVNQTAAEAGLAEASHTHTESNITDLGSYEDDLGDPGTDDYVLSSTAAGVRSWIENATGDFPSEYHFVIADYTSYYNRTSWFRTNNIFYFTDDMVPDGASIYFNAFTQSDLNANTGSLRIVKESDGSVVTDSTISRSSAANVGRVESSAITLVDGTIYAIEVKASIDFSYINFYRTYLSFR